MKRWPAVVSLLLLSAAPVALAVEAGDAAPSWRSTDLAGHEVVFPQPSADQTTVLVFWATWCNYCRAFMPYLDAIQEDFDDRNVRVMAINAKESKEGEDGDPRAYVEKNGYLFTTVLEGDAIAEAYGVEFIPGLFVVDADGMIMYRRGWTELPAGRTVAELWDSQVRSALSEVLR